MPTPDRTSITEIMAAGRRLLEAGGLPALTMQAVATEVGVRGPSLYKRVAGRDALIRLIAEQTAGELGDSLATAATAEPDAGRRLALLADALRDFARANPASYRLVFAPHSDESAPAREILARASAPVLEVAAQLAGQVDALSAARTLTAWAHGFITMELAGAFRLGGDVDDAWTFGLTMISRSLDRRGVPQQPAR